MDLKILTRRDFLKGTAVAAGALYVGGSEKVFAQSAPLTRVVVVRRKDVLDDLNKPNAEILSDMLDEGVTALFETSDIQTAWKKIVKTDDTVGIKTNNWRFLATPPELEQAIKRRVIEVGVPETKIGIKDWGVLNDPIFTGATALINTSPMRTHHWAGVGTLLKNYILFVPKPSDYHPDTCADLATIWKLPIVAGKTRLNVLVMLTPLFHGEGPHHFNPQYIWKYNGLILGTDPVAVDSTGVRIILNKRKEYFKEDRPLNPPPKHIFLADTRHGLGTADPAKIQLVQLGWKEESYL